MIGNKNPNWKGGNSRCLVCNKLLASRYAKHCKKHRPVTRRTRKLLSKIHKGNTNGFKKGFIPWNKGKPYLAIRGEKNPNWGKFGPAHPKWTGRTLLTKSIRACPKYQTWRFSIFQQDNFICQGCDKNGIYLEADHYPIGFAYILNKYQIKTFQEAMNCKALWSAKGRTMCQKCHPRPGRLPIKTVKLLKSNFLSRYFLTN